MAELHKPLTAWRGAGMMVNIVLGAGLLTLPGLAYAMVGTGAFVVWLACAAIAAPLLAVFAVLGRRWPASGGLATILARGFGDTGYAVGTLLFLGAVLLGLPAIAMTGGHYMATALGGPAPGYALALIVLATATNMFSSGVAARVNAWLACALVLALVGLLAAGWAATGPTIGDAIPMQATRPTLGVYGVAVMMVFFAFTGWELAASLGGEFKRPHRDIPLAMAGSFVIVLALYLGLALVVNAAALESGFEAPFAAIIGNRFGIPGTIAVSIVSVLLILANLMGAIWAVSRMVFAAAGEGLLPAVLADARRGVPRRALGATGAALVAVVLTNWSGYLDLGTLLTLAGQNFLLLYAGAAAVLTKCARARWETVLGLICLGLVAGVMVLRGPGGLAYPVTLILAGLALGHCRHGQTGWLPPVGDGLHWQRFGTDADPRDSRT
jgi:amino acid efflux transporter